MSISYLLIALIAMFGHSEDFLGTTLLSRPLVLGPLVGLVLGDLYQGVIIGATLELIFMGNIKVGAAIPPDVITGGVLGTAFAIISGKGPAIALAIAVPVSILAEMLISSLFVFRAVINKKFNQYADAGDFNGIQRLHILSGILRPILMGIIVLLALLLGGTVMKDFLDLIPAWVQTGLQVAGNMLPALGFALLMHLMFNKTVAPYFFLGFMLAAYLKLPVIAIGGLGVVIALIVTQVTPKTDDDSDFDEIKEEVTPSQKLSKGDIRNVFLRSMALEANFNFETWQNTGFAFAIIPVLKRLYTTKEAMAKALKRHLQFFNTSPYGSTLILGITAAMEEQNSNDVEFDAESISSVKLGLMGPLAGVFDSLFWGTFKVIAAGVGTSLAIKGNIMGPILFLLIFNVPHLVLRYNLTFIGYRAGTKFLQNLAKNNVMDRLTKGASILGLMVVGAMPATLMSITTPISIGSDKSEVTIQSVLDQVVPAIIPLGLTFLVYYFVKNGAKTTHLLLGLLALGFIGSMIHLFA
ncbi:PTS system mannose/fructose/sorbose family transporter subunit IID [Mucilaginibacter sp. BJC16-A38]|uniref:PTS system mannose/fructose/sorbose family transporter subunit IID n=1 Tax=Mucilaginibacter phenanthrenivorans TaxID=1234842 RepID=UPI0021571509|nr:PTS system mannose/fructose/sorbose family transporter subunit IID [Mucilaginibacter phenanthrenivorans]MCR8558930.1 PTS system mannose/fructose/sorbose family transporter subunit IID [Mucilaginibacter phenanthrenivorans]